MRLRGEKPVMYVSKTLRTLPVAGMALVYSPATAPAVLRSDETLGLPSDGPAPAGGLTDNPEALPDRPYYLLTPLVYAYIMTRLLSLERRSWGTDGKDEDQPEVMTRANAAALLAIAAKRMAAIQNYVDGQTAGGSQRWTVEGFDRWRECLNQDGKAPGLPTSPAVSRVLPGTSKCTN